MQFPARKQAERGERNTTSFWNGFLDFLYIIGIQTVRILKRIGRRLRRFFRPVGILFKRLYAFTLGRQFHKIGKELSRIRHGMTVARSRISAAQKKGFFSCIAELFRVAGRFFCRHKNLFATAFHIAAPVASVVLLVFTVRYWTGLSYGLELDYGGESAGMIEDEETFSLATQMVSQRMIHTVTGKESESAPVRITPVFRLAVANKGSFVTANAICDTIIRNSSDIIEEAAGLYVDGQLIGAVKSSADLNYLLESLLEEAKGGDKNAKAEFAQDVQTAAGLFPTSVLVTTQEMREYLTAKEREASVYTVQEGDTLYQISQTLGVSAEELDQLNGGTLLNGTLQIGQLILVETAVPRMSVKLIRKEIYEQALPYQTVVEKDDDEYTDYNLVKIEGVSGVQQCEDSVTYMNGVEVDRQQVSRTVLTPATDRVVVVGTKKRPTGYEPGESSGELIWPVPSLHTITSPFGGRWGRMHKGIDISGGAAEGRPIVAADGGTVILADWYDGYGKCVIIRHANGMETLYGHCSALLVTSGQAVAKGQTIARVGNTGNSFGAHCHFEVRINGEHQNPLDYVS